MPSRAEIQKIIDLCAESISIVESDAIRFDHLCTLDGFNRTLVDYKQQLDDMFSKDTSVFLSGLSEMVQQIREDSNVTKRTIKAYSVSVWIDAHLSYQAEIEKNTISLYPLCKINQTSPFIMDSLNSNYDQTHIWINPKLPIRKTYDEGRGEERPNVLSSSLKGINGDLINISYFHYDGTFRVKNVVISDTSLFDEGRKDLTIAFAPITSEKGLINKTEVTIKYNNRDTSAVELSLKYGFEHFSERLKNDWILAAKNKADILFMPEMLGTEESHGLNRNSIEWVEDLSCNLLSESADVPAMTVLPSRWFKRHNSATIVSGNGKVMGVQDKYEPYINRTDYKMEALSEQQEKTMIVFHIPNVHRIAVIICSEYLADVHVKWSDILCRCLGVSLILVPSFSPGEQDFYAALDRYREFDTTIVWGNCCGAGKSETKGIGGCSIAGVNENDTFGAVCKCDHSCSNVKSCVFAEKLSLQITKSKIKIHSDEHQLNHIVL